jgi:SH3-like domain-containing protein
MKNWLFLMVFGFWLVMPAAVSAQNAKTPYWASIRSEEVNLRAGPGEDYRINWVYHRQHLPLKVIRTKDGWRLVQDSAGNQGWMLSRFLTRERGAVVTGRDLAEMREKGDRAARLLWRVQPGVVGLLGDCGDGWCGFSVGDQRGFVQQNQLWGAGEP